jgi:hypothetical protein
MTASSCSRYINPYPVGGCRLERQPPNHNIRRGVPSRGSLTVLVRALLKEARS